MKEQEPPKSHFSKAAALSVGSALTDPGPGEVYALPTSLGQERFWGLDRLNPGNPTWMVPVRFRLQGPLNPDCVRRAFNEIVARHESLRTTFTLIDRQLFQLIQPSLKIEVPVTDLRHLAKAERDAEVDRLSFEEARRGFDLTVGPLFRVGLMRVEDNEHVLLVTPHHSVVDYWSIGLISNELGALYEGYSRGTDPVLPELPVQYGDFAVWQREQAARATVQNELAYWKGQLKDLPLLEFPSDCPRRNFPTYEATITSLLLSVHLTDAMKDIANRAGATFFNTMLAALGVVLCQYTGQTNFGVGTQVAGRTNVELEPLIGLFINTVILRMDLTGDPTFPQLLARVQDVGLQSLANQNVRFEQVLKELRPDDYPSHHTLFRVNFICQRDPVKPLEFSGIRLTVIPSKSQGALYDLNVFLVLRTEGWRLACEYNTDLFEASTIIRLLGNYRKLLESIVDNPNQHISEFPLPEGIGGSGNKKPTADSANRAGNGILGDGAVPQSLGTASAEQGTSQKAASPPPTSFDGPAAEHYAMPASLAQRRFWMLEEIAPGNPALHMRACVRLKGVVAHPILEKSLQFLVDRHESLRTTFVKANDELNQVIVPSRIISLPVTSLEDVSEAHREARLWDAIRVEASAPFDLVRGPLIRSRLFRLGPQEHVLVISTHHILTDGWSQNIIQRDLWATYEALLEDRKVSLPPLAIQYADFVQWQHAWLASDSAREQIEFWKKQLAGPLPVLDLPTDNPSRKGPASQGPMETILLPEDLIRSLKTLGQSQDATMFMVMLTAYGALLNRYTDQEDTLIGSPIANRRAETEGLIGPFAGPLALRLNLSGNPTLPELLERVRDVTLNALSHTDPPFEAILEELDVRTVRGRNPLSQCYFFYQTAFLQPRELSGLTVTPLSDFGLGTHFELQMGLLERGEGVRAQLEYNPDLFEASTIKEVLTSYEALLRAFVANPEQRLADLPLSDHAKRRAGGWPTPQKEYVAPRDPLEIRLAQIWTQLLGIERFGINDNFFHLGGQSLLAMKAMSRIRDAFEVDLPLRTVFANPTIAGLATSLREAKGVAISTQRISRRTDGMPCPMSFSQERMWFLDKLAPGNPVYNIVDVTRFSGALDTGAVKRALNELLRRHEILRTAISTIDGQQVQVVAPTIDLALPEKDLSTLPEQNCEDEWVRLANADGRTPFDLSKAPLIRVKLIKLSQEEHLLLLTIHHIISDEWSIGIFRRELRTIYEAFAQGLPSPLPELPIQYADFASWQRDWMRGEELEGHISYWKKQLEGASAVLNLPTDKPRPPVQSFRGATTLFEMPKELLDAMKALGREEEATLFMTLAAGFMTLLHRYTGQNDILVGTPVSGRTRSELEGLIGLFLNTVVLRARFSDNSTFRSLLRQVRETALGAYAHHNLPLGHLVAELAPKRHLSYSPLLQVMFVVHTGDDSSGDQDWSVASARQVDTGTSKFDLSLSFFPTAGKLTGLVEYSTDLFDADTIQRLCGHFRTLLESAVTDPEAPLSQLPLLAADEEYRLLIEQNDTAVDHRQRSRCLQEILQEQVERTPDQVAIVFEQEQLTYRELNERSNQLANYLQKQGVCPDVLVGVCMERSIEMVVALLGILKAGGAYVPLDPAYPPERVSFVLADANVPILLTQQRVARNLAIAGTPLVCLDTDWDQIDRESRDTPDVAITSGDLAYVIYTSGSTGKPKGVEIPHRALVNLLNSMRSKPGLEPRDTLLAVTTVSFDIAALELFLPLCVGARLVIASREAAANGHRLLEQLMTSGATVMQATPVTWKLLLEAGWDGNPRLKVLCGGEAFPRELVNQLVKRASSVWNMYGPTETTIWSAVGEVKAGEGRVVIGPPIDNTQFYVLDANGQLVPIGAPGELHIGGDGLARGYFRRPELTAEKFIHNRFTGNPDARLYKTGDLVRRLPDGTLEFLGRLDNQVKVRGFRIELGEIETLLTEHPEVRQVVVVLSEDSSGEKRLVAYVVPGDIKRCGATGLRDFLRKKLPEFMVPATFVFLPHLPLSPNGKIDRSALPCSSYQVVNESSHFVAPSSQLEKDLAAIWEEILGVRNIGTRDNFFDLGGHSLAAVRLFARIEKAFNVKMPLSALFEAQTIEELARILPCGRTWSEWSPLVEIQRGGSRPPFFCVHGAGGNVLIYRDLAQRLGPDQPFYGLQSQGLDGERPSLTRVEDMAALYVQEVQRVQPRGPYLIGGYCMGGTVAVEMAQQLKSQGEQVALLALFDTMNWSNLGRVTIWDRVYYQGQRLAFHVGNFLLLDFRDQIELLREKQKVLSGRSTVWRGLLLNKLGQKQHGNRPESRLLARIWGSNDRAIRNYFPQPYPGVITDFRPMQQYTVFNKPGMHWEDLALEGQEIVILPVYPAAMLVEPFVKYLAEALRATIDKAIQEPSVAYTEIREPTVRLEQVYQ